MFHTNNSLFWHLNNGHIWIITTSHNPNTGQSVPLIPLYCSIQIFCLAGNIYFFTHLFFHVVMNWIKRWSSFTLNATLIARDLNPSPQFSTRKRPDMEHVIKITSNHSHQNRLWSSHIILTKMFFLSIQRSSFWTVLKNN